MSRQIEYLKFQNWDEWLEYVSQPIPADAGQGSIIRFARRDWSTTEQFGYSMTKSYEEALELARTGWHSAEADARKVSGKLLQQVGSVIEQDMEQLDYVGQGLDVANFLRGVPEHWVRYERKWEDAPGPIVKVVFNIAAEFHTQVGTLITRGAAVAGMIECIELTGRSVELWTSNYSSDWFGAHDGLDMRVKIKDAGQPLDMGRVMFALAHPSMLRRLSFRAVELWPEARHLSQDGSYGHPANVPETEDRGDIYIPSINWGEAEQWKDEFKTRKWVLDKLKEQGIAINDEGLQVPPIDIHHNIDNPFEGLEISPGGFTGTPEERVKELLEDFDVTPTKEDLEGIEVEKVEATADEIGAVPVEGGEEESEEFAGEGDEPIPIDEEEGEEFTESEDGDTPVGEEDEDGEEGLTEDEEGDIELPGDGEEEGDEPSDEPGDEPGDESGEDEGDDEGDDAGEDEGEGDGEDEEEEQKVGSGGQDGDTPSLGISDEPGEEEGEPEPHVHIYHRYGNNERLWQEAEPVVEEKEVKLAGGLW